MPYKLMINGRSHAVDVEADTPLLWVLRDVIGLTGTKFGCGRALCGACTVHIDGNPTRSCSTSVESAAKGSISTIEAMVKTPIGRRVQAAWIAHEVPQCGYCQSGQIMSACALLKQVPRPTEADVNAAMSGNLCRCGTYPRIKAAVLAAASNPTPPAKA